MRGDNVLIYNVNQDSSTWSRLGPEAGGKELFEDLLEM